MLIRVNLLLLFFFFGATVATKTTYHGWKIFQLTATQAQLERLHQFDDDPEFDFWSRHRVPGVPISLMVGPASGERFVTFLEEHGISYLTSVVDVQQLFDAEKQRQASVPSNGKITFDKYYTHSEINAYLDELAVSYPSITTVETIGRTSEDRDMRMIKISTGGSGSNPVIFIDGGMHACEWIGHGMALYIIQQLAENEANRQLLEGVDWHILPVVNPDGYMYTQEYTRLWRKTRSVLNNSVCHGVDPNRNFGHHWDEGGASHEGCNPTYNGPAAFSEPETAAVRDYMHANRDNMKLYLTLHSYGNMFLYPWSYTTDSPPNWEEMDSLGHAANDAQVAAGGESYIVGESTHVLGMTTGSSDDWMMGVEGVPLAYTMELPGGGVFGFDLPASQLLETVTIAFESIRVFGEYIQNRGK